MAGDYAFRVEGAKTAAFELIDQFFYKVPAAVVVPIGCGTNMAGYAKGFFEYQELGYIKRVPKIIGTQAAGANPVVRAIKNGTKGFEPLAKISTVCGAIAVGDPLDGLKAIDAIRRTEGNAFSVTDEQSLQAQYTLANEEGLFVEVSSATAIAALEEIASAHPELQGKDVVCVLTGDGLKDSATLLKQAIQPPTIYPSIEEFSRLYERNIFKARSVVFVDRAKKIISNSICDNSLRAVLEEYFGIEYTADVRESMISEIDAVLKKGKSVSLADLQDILQVALVQDKPKDTQAKLDLNLKVLDFWVETGKDKPSHARVEISLNGDAVHKGEATGTGPVDAIITALKNAAGVAINFEILEFNVGIRDQGANAVVVVDIKLGRDGSVSVGSGTSPDIIQASISAFLKAANRF